MKKVFLGRDLTLTILLTILFLSSGFLKAESSFRLVVSAGALSDFNPDKSFYQSRVFSGEENAPFVIANADVQVFENDQAIFFSQEDAKKEGIQNALLTTKKSVAGIKGHSYRGFPLEGAISDLARRYLGADSLQVSSEKRTINGKSIVAFAKNEKGEITWPHSLANLKRVPAIILHDKKGARFLVVARLVGSLSNRLGLVDALMAKKAFASGLIDLGTNHGIGKTIPPESITLLAKRHPFLVFPGTFEMASLITKPSDFDGLPLVYPFGDHFRRTVTIEGKTQSNEKIHFWSITGGEKLWPLYNKLGKRVALDDAIAAMQSESADPNRALNIVRVFSDEEAREAAKSVYVDLVLLLAKDPYAQLASKETIELKEAKTDAYEQIAPIVRISYLDVSEIFIFGKTIQSVQRVEVIRHPITDDGPKAIDVEAFQKLSELQGLPDLSVTLKKDDRAWHKIDLERVLGGIMLDETKADIAIFEALPYITPIHGPISFDLAKSLLNVGGNLSVITISGKQIKKIGSLISENQLGRKLVIYGMDTKRNAIGDRVFNENERFSIVATEAALLELFGLGRMGGFGEQYAIRAPFVEAIYGDIRQLWFAGGPKVIAIADTEKEIETALKDVRSGLPLDDLLDEFFSKNETHLIRSFITMYQGQPHHVIMLDVAYLDLGISKNVANSVYETYLKNGLRPIGRSKVPVYTHLLLLLKMALNYDTAHLQTSLTGDIKYMHTKLEEEPDRDKTKIGLNFRLPFERSYFKESSVVLAPIWKNLYETKLAPNFLTSFKAKEPRTQRVDTLLGANLDFTKLGFNCDVGPIMAVDFTRKNPNDAIDFGPSFNFYSKWGLWRTLELSSEIRSYYLFPLPLNKATDKMALGVEGTVWLRLARFHDLSIALMSDFLVETLQQAPKSVALSSIFGLTLSYGRLFRLLG